VLKESDEYKQSDYIKARNHKLLDFLRLSRKRYLYLRSRASKVGMLHWTWWLLTLALQGRLYRALQPGTELGGCQGATAPPKFCLATPVAPKIYQVSFWKSYTDHWQLPLLQNSPLQWPPKWKCLAPPLSATKIICHPQSLHAWLPEITP